jgi:hypothetical protein
VESLRVIKMRLESFDTRLRRGERQAVHATVQEMVDGFRASGLENSLLAEWLRALALADAGSEGSSSVCYWHAAQTLHGDLYHADLAAYGFAGALLEGSIPGG